MEFGTNQLQTSSEQAPKQLAEWNLAFSWQILFWFLPDYIIVAWFAEYHLLLRDLSHRPPTRALPFDPNGGHPFPRLPGKPHFPSPWSAPEEDHPDCKKPAPLITKVCCESTHLTRTVWLINVSAHIRSGKDRQLMLILTITLNSDFPTFAQKNCCYRGPAPEVNIQ